MMANMQRYKIYNSLIDIISSLVVNLSSIPLCGSNVEPQYIEFDIYILPNHNGGGIVMALISIENASCDMNKIRMYNRSIINIVVDALAIFSLALALPPVMMVGAYTTFNDLNTGLGINASCLLP
jgi:hypothetical protein